MNTALPHKSSLSRTERRRFGKALRLEVPRESHSGLGEPANDRNPLNTLKAQDVGRVERLLPIKYGRMLASPFSYLRGSAIVMAGDLSATPSCDLEVMLCGDAHLSNFGFFASPERNLVFDLNDFDEVYPGSFEWDIKRLAASAVVAGRNSGFSEEFNRHLSREVARMYRKAMRQFSKLRTIDVWYYYLDSKTLKQFFSESASSKASKLIDKVIKKARSKTSERTLGKFTQKDAAGDRWIEADPPLLVPLRKEYMERRA